MTLCVAEKAPKTPSVFRFVYIHPTLNVCRSSTFSYSQQSTSRRTNRCAVQAACHSPARRDISATMSRSFGSEARLTPQPSRLPVATFRAPRCSMNANATTGKSSSSLTGHRVLSLYRNFYRTSNT